MSPRTAWLSDRTVVDPTGEKLGKVSDVLFDDIEDNPSWLVVNPGLFKAEHYVPADGAYLDDDEHVVIPYDAETVLSSPKATSDHVVSTAARSVLRDHYARTN